MRCKPPSEYLQYFVDRVIVNGAYAASLLCYQKTTAEEPRTKVV